MLTMLPDDTYSSVADLFQYPPEWISRQVKECQKDPDRLIGPLCAAVASTVHGDGLRADEVRDEVEAILRVLSDGG